MTRTQAFVVILMIDPLPSVSKVFNLAIQEEHQRSIALVFQKPSDSIAPTLLSTLAAPLIVPSMSQSRQQEDSPICSQWGLTGHTVDKCYKIHGYPPGYKVEQDPSPSTVPSRALFNPQSELNRHLLQLPL